MSNELKIIIAGKSKAGKSSIGLIIKEALDKFALQPVLVDSSAPHNPEQQQSQRMQRLRSEGLKITIQTVVVPPEGILNHVVDIGAKPKPQEESSDGEEEETPDNG